MAKIKKWSSQEILYEISNGNIKDFYGRCLFQYDECSFRKWGGLVTYNFVGNQIKKFAGLVVLKYEGNYIKEFSGKIIGKIENGYVKRFSGVMEYIIDGYLTHTDTLALITLLYLSQ